MRRAAWAPLPADAINADFILTMEILGRGWRVAYDDSIIAWEAEISSVRPAADSTFFTLLAAPRVLVVARYAVSGHRASLTGVTRFCARRDRKPWARAET